MTSRPACVLPEAEAVAPAKQTDSQKAWKQCSYVVRVRAGSSNETFCRLVLRGGQLSSLGSTALTTRPQTLAKGTLGSVNDDLSAMAMLEACFD